MAEIELRAKERLVCIGNAKTLTIFNKLVGYLALPVPKNDNKKLGLLSLFLKNGKIVKKLIRISLFS